MQKTDYGNALEVGFGVFGAMQRRILEADLRAAYLETFGKRTIQSVNSPQARLFAATLYDSDIYQMQPEDELPVGAVGFEDARRGFVPYRYGQD